LYRRSGSLSKLLVEERLLRVERDVFSPDDVRQIALMRLADLRIMVDLIGIEPTTS